MIELRAGTGGDEAAIWAGDLLTSYQKYAALNGWTSMILSETAGSEGGFRAVTLQVNGDAVYSKMKVRAHTRRARPHTTTTDRHDPTTTAAAFALCRAK